MPCRSSSDGGNFTARSSNSVGQVMKQIVHQPDPALTDIFAATDWVRGWGEFLNKCLRCPMKPKRPPSDTDTLAHTLDGLSEQVERSLDQGQPGPSVFGSFPKDTSDSFDRTDQANTAKRLRNFPVANRCNFSTYLRLFKASVSALLGGKRRHSSTDVMVQGYVRNSICKQFPTIVSSVFPRKKATAEVPYSSVAAMWSAIDHHKTNKKPAINGPPHSSMLIQPPMRCTPSSPLSSRRITNFSSSNHSPGSQHCSGKPSQTWVSDSVRKDGSAIHVHNDLTRLTQTRRMAS